LPGGKGGISLLNFMQEDPKTWVFLSCLPDQREFLRPIFSSQLSLMIKGLMRRAEQGSANQNNARTWIIIDELASLNKLPALLLGLAEIRKYGGCFVLGFQDLSQLEEIYGSQATKTLSNLTGTKLLFRSIDTDVAMRVARYLGEQEKQESNESISFGAHQMRDGVNLSNQKQTKAVVTASQIMMLKDLEAYLKFPQDLPITKVQFKYLEIEKSAPAFVERRLKRGELVVTLTPLNDEGVVADTSALPIINFNQPEQAQLG
jgi:type IV secretory pathway TraG/TraD family ATPase VirD4